MRILPTRPDGLPLALSLTILTAVLVGHAATLAGTPVIPGCPCVFLGMGPAEGASALSLEALSAGALLALSAIAAALLALSLCLGIARTRRGAPDGRPIDRHFMTIRTHPPLRSTATILSRKMRFRRASSTSLAGLTHSAV